MGTVDQESPRCQHEDCTCFIVPVCHGQRPALPHGVPPHAIRGGGCSSEISTPRRRRSRYIEAPARGRGMMCSPPGVIITHSQLIWGRLITTDNISLEESTSKNETVRFVFVLENIK